VPDPDSQNVEDLRKRAGDLDITGRSKMDAEQLAAAVTIAERKQAEADAAIAARVAAPGDEQRFPVSRLRAQPQIHGHGTPAFAAALAFGGVSDDDELSRREVDELIERSQQHPVQVEEA
jgi:hypothetical protein